MHDRRRGISPARDQTKLDLSYRNTFERLSTSKPFMETLSNNNPSKPQQFTGNFGGTSEKAVPLPLSMTRFVGGSLNFKDIRSLNEPKGMRSLSGKK